jgi:DNA-binding MarR family transcriptional regulator
MRLESKYQQKFTTGQVLILLHDGEKSLREIIDELGCCKSTADNLIKILLEMKKIKRRNIGSEKKALWIYSSIEANDKK